MDGIYEGESYGATTHFVVLNMASYASSVDRLDVDSFAVLQARAVCSHHRATPAGRVALNITAGRRARLTRLLIQSEMTVGCEASIPPA